MKINVQMFDDLMHSLSQLGEFLTNKYPHSSKNPVAHRMIEEARVHTFLSCHALLYDLLESMHDSIPPTKQSAQPQNKIADTLAHLVRERLITVQQMRDFAQLFDAATLLSYDRVWLETSEEQKMFEERASLIGRYQYGMNLFVSTLSRHSTGITQEKHHETA